MFTLNHTPTLTYPKNVEACTLCKTLRGNQKGATNALLCWSTLLCYNTKATASPKHCGKLAGNLGEANWVYEFYSPFVIVFKHGLLVLWTEKSLCSGGGFKINSLKTTDTNHEPETETLKNSFFFYNYIFLLVFFIYHYVNFNFNLEVRNKKVHSMILTKISAHHKKLYNIHIFGSFASLPAVYLKLAFYTHWDNTVQFCKYFNSMQLIGACLWSCRSSYLHRPKIWQK